MAERILDIVAEDPEKQHVAGQMPEIEMKKGIGDGGEVIRHDLQGGFQIGVIEHHGGNEAEAEGSGIGFGVAGQHAGKQPDQHVDHDQADGDILQPDMLEGIRIVQRYEHRTPFGCVVETP
ncbi:hypothetical protein QE453_000539 [Agrobacterium sp. SORGH_AS440]|nr:hypothetical protein [Agrobacterium sp. SORGH_AS_0440]